MEQTQTHSDKWIQAFKASRLTTRAEHATEIAFGRTKDRVTGATIGTSVVELQFTQESIEDINIRSVKYESDMIIDGVEGSFDLKTIAEGLEPIQEALQAAVNESTESGFKEAFKDLIAAVDDCKVDIDTFNLIVNRATSLKGVCPAQLISIAKMWFVLHLLVTHHEI
jgi:hypothetical protein